MLSWLQTTLQEILDTKTTTLKYVKVFDINSQVQATKLAKDEDTLTIVYRELPSQLAELASKDRIINASFDILAIEKEKIIVQQVFEDFLEDYNNTFVTDRWVYFTNLTPSFAPENKGATLMQRWNLGLTAQIIDQVANLKDITVTINSSAYTLEDGLFSFEFRKVNSYGEFPITLYMTEELKQIDTVVSISFIDLKDTTLRSILYGTVYSVTLTIADSTDTTTFTAKVHEVVKSAQAKAFPTIRITFRRG
jgi:hypothetical protein